MGSPILFGSGRPRPPFPGMFRQDCRGELCSPKEPRSPTNNGFIPVHFRARNARPYKTNAVLDCRRRPTRNGRPGPPAHRFPECFVRIVGANFVRPKNRARPQITVLFRMIPGRAMRAPTKPTRFWIVGDAPPGTAGRVSRPPFPGIFRQNCRGELRSPKEPRSPANNDSVPKDSRANTVRPYKLAYPIEKLSF